MQLAMDASAHEAAAAAAAAATAAAAARKAGGARGVGDETIGKINQRRRQLLAAATPGVGIEAQLVFEGKRPSVAAEPASPSHPTSTKCIVCRGTGQTSHLLTPEQAVACGCRSVLDPDDFACGVCFGDGEYCLATSCKQHFFCRDCIDGTLKATVELGQFPAICPTCRVDAPKGEPVGRIDEQALTFLHSRGVISRDLFFRFRKAAAAAEAPAEAGSSSSAAPAAADASVGYSACPAGCGHWLLDEHPSYAPPGEPRLGAFFDVKQGVAVRLGCCPCGALICSRCKGLVPAAERLSHLCKDATADDPASRELIAKIGKACPACGLFIEKNAGCSSMMCGTRAHGNIQEALRNGGCAHEFDWNSMRPLKNGRPGHPFNDRQVKFRYK